MSRARPVFPGDTYLVTRRCRDRQFLLRPDDATNQAFLYCLAYAAHLFNVGVITFLATGNHWHGVLVDHDGRMPEFLRTFHALLAKHQNRLRGRWENFWASTQTSVVRVVDLDDLLDKVAYTLCNPVKDNLVERAQHWPGASSLFALRDGGTIKATRPRRFFDAQGTMPDTITLKLHTPDGFHDLRAFRRQVEALIQEREQAAAQLRRASGARVLGRKAILQQDWRACPDSLAPRRNLSPHLACRDPNLRIHLLRQRREWLDAYRAARLAWLAGDPHVIFPPGTYWLRHHAGVTCAEPC
jgi:putative transposase